jgi:hypothetical protein
MDEEMDEDEDESEGMELATGAGVDPGIPAGRSAPAT